MKPLFLQSVYQQTPYCICPPSHTSGYILQNFFRLKDESSVLSVAFNPNDSNQLASGTLDGNINIWSIEAKSMLMILNEQSPVSCVRYNPFNPNQLAAALGDGSVSIWDLPEQRRITRLNGHQNNVYTIAFNPHTPNQLASGAEDAKVIIWNLETKEPLYRLNTEDYVTDLSFDPVKPNILVAGTGDGVSRWTLQAEPSSKKYRIREVVLCIQYSPSGEYIACGTYSGKVIKIYPRSGITETLAQMSSSIHTLSFHPKEVALFATGSNDGYISFWNIYTNRRMGVTNELAGNPIFSLTYDSKGDYLAAGLEDGSIAVMTT